MALASTTSFSTLHRLSKARQMLLKTVLPTMYEGWLRKDAIGIRPAIPVPFCKSHKMALHSQGAVNAPLKVGWCQQCRPARLPSAWPGKWRSAAPLAPVGRHRSAGMLHPPQAPAKNTLSLLGALNMLSSHLLCQSLNLPRMSFYTFYDPSKQMQSCQPYIIVCQVRDNSVFTVLDKQH